MIGPIRKALFPGVLGGIFCLLYFVSLANPPAPALAAGGEPDKTDPPSHLQSPATFAPLDLHPESLSPAGILLNLFLPLIHRAEMLIQSIEAAPPPSPPAEEEQSRAEERGSSGCPLSESYSERVRAWCDLIRAAADAHGLDPNLVAAVMTVESAGNPDAYSHSGAVGLMQVMPRDGLAASFQCPNGPCFAKRPSMAELYDPAFNLEYACGMLAGLFNRHGNWRDALRAYGPAGAGYSYADKVLGLYERNR